jgi:hypothetical protein
MGCRRGWPGLAGLPWSTQRLGAALADACEAAGLGVGWLPAHTDVDSLQSLAVVATQLRDDPRPARRALLEWIEREQDSIGSRRTA